MRKLFWHNGAEDPLMPFENEGMAEIKRLVPDKEILTVKWDICRLTSDLRLKVICSCGTVFRFYLDWYSG